MKIEKPSLGNSWVQDFGWSRCYPVKSSWHDRLPHMDNYQKQLSLYVNQ